MDGSSFGEVQIIMIRPENLIEHDPNDLYTTKTIWTVQNGFGPIAGQGISQY